MVIFLIFLTVFFGLPILSDNVKLPKNLSSEELGTFLGSILHYWLDLITHALRKLGYSLRY